MHKLLVLRLLFLLTIIIYLHVSQIATTSGNYDAYHIQCSATNFTSYLKGIDNLLSCNIFVTSCLLKKITTGVSEIYFLEYFLEIPEIYVPT